jgi:hypothetical protein
MSGGDILWGEGEQAVTVGRKKRKRKKGAGTGVKVKGHTRSPRGPNGGKRKVRVDGYARGAGKRKRSRRKKR